MSIPTLNEHRIDLIAREVSVCGTDTRQGGVINIARMVLRGEKKVERVGNIGSEEGSRGGYTVR
jgi:hypothetical protein